MRTPAALDATAAADEAARGRRVRRSALLWLAVAAAFYFGFIIMTLLRAQK